MAIHMKMILLSLVMLLIAFEPAFSGKILKKLDKELKKMGLQKLQKFLADIGQNALDIGDVQNDIGDVQNEIDSNTVHIKNNTMDIGSNTMDIGSNTLDIHTNANEIDSNIAHIDNNAMNIGDVQNDIGDVQNEIGDIQNEIDSNTARIDNNAVNIGDVQNDIAEATKCTAVDWSYSCCTSANPCSFGKGDCDENDHSTCSGDLKCGVNNCLSNFGFGDNGADCCYLETIGSGSVSVWFDAWRASDFETFSWKKITYTNVRESSSNSGAMDIGTGIFSAPLAGTYQFIIQVLKGDDVGVVEICGDLLNECFSRIVDLDETNSATITGTAIIEMQPGQKVWAETFHTVIGPRPTIHFTGVLITQ